MDIRMIGGCWRKISGDSIETYTTYQDAASGKVKPFEDDPLVTSDRFEIKKFLKFREN